MYAKVLAKSREECENKGLSLNTQTKVLVFERDEERTECKISVNGKILEQVNVVVYLRIMFSENTATGRTFHSCMVRGRKFLRNENSADNGE